MVGCLSVHWRVFGRVAAKGIGVSSNSQGRFRGKPADRRLAPRRCFEGAPMASPLGRFQFQHRPIPWLFVRPGTHWWHLAKLPGTGEQRLKCQHNTKFWKQAEGSPQIWASQFCKHSQSLLLGATGAKLA